MKKLLKYLLPSLLVGLAMGGTVYGVSVFNSQQLAPTPHAGNCLTTNGGNPGVNSWSGCGSGGSGATTTINSLSGPNFTFTGSGVTIATSAPSTVSFTVSAGGGSGVPSTTPFTSGYVPYATSTLALTNSNIFQSSNGNLGIGSTSPGQLLSVGSVGLTATPFTQGTDGNILLSAASTFPGGVGNGASIIWNGAIANGYGNSLLAQIQPSTTNSINSLNFYVGAWNNHYATGNSVMTLQQSGNVGIGTTSPQALLHIGADNASSPDLLIGSGLNVANYLSVSGGRAMFGYSGSSLILNAGTSKDIGFYVGGVNGSFPSGTQAMEITTTGNVGIGTTSPGSLLTVGNNNQFTVDSNGIVIGTRLKAVKSSGSAEMDLVSGANQLTAYYDGSAHIYTTSGNLNLGGSTADVVTINQGNVGIGTTSPSQLLTVGSTATNFTVDNSGNTVTNGYGYISCYGREYCNHFERV